MFLADVTGLFDRYGRPARADALNRSLIDSGSVTLTRVWPHPGHTDDFVVLEAQHLDEAIAVLRAAGLQVEAIAEAELTTADHTSTGEGHASGSLPQFLPAPLFGKFDWASASELAFGSDLCMSLSPPELFCKKCQHVHRLGKPCPKDPPPGPSSFVV